MEVALALVIGVLYGCGVYLLLRRNTLKFIIALGLISNATHLLIFNSAGLTRGAPPLVPTGETTLGAPYADPLPQALILTAIVISFGLTAFMILLVQRSHATLRTDDPAELTHTDRLGPYKSQSPGAKPTGKADPGPPAKPAPEAAPGPARTSNPASLDDRPRTRTGTAPDKDTERDSGPEAPA